DPVLGNSANVVGCEELFEDFCTVTASVKHGIPVRVSLKSQAAKEVAWYLLPSLLQAGGSACALRTGCRWPSSSWCWSRFGSGNGTCAGDRRRKNSRGRCRATPTSLTPRIQRRWRSRLMRHPLTSGRGCSKWDSGAADCTVTTGSIVCLDTWIGRARRTSCLNFRD